MTANTHHTKLKGDIAVAAVIFALNNCLARPLSLDIQSSNTSSISRAIKLIFILIKFGANSENRTRIIWVEARGTTIIPYPHWQW